ncbi:MAG: TetR family transcriptional regulator [Rhodospirillales bacterium]|nr:TetR family transcriptional regulator [Rhodospirillales bacterium]
MAAKRSSTAPKADPGEAALDAMLRLAAERRWAEMALSDIAAEAGLTMADMLRHAPSKTALLAAFGRRVDAAMLAKPAETQGSVKDRLFDLIMRRFDALAPHKPAVRNIVAGLGRDPLAALCLVPGAMKGIAGLAEAAGVNTRLPFGPLKIKALAAVYLGTFRVWLADESADAAKTMASLDRSLGRLEALVSSFPTFPNGSKVQAGA